MATDKRAPARCVCERERDWKSEEEADGRRGEASGISGQLRPQRRREGFGRRWEASFSLATPGT